MTNTKTFVVYTDGPSGSYPYGVFTNREAANDAREAIIKKLDSGMSDVLDDESRTLAHQLAGTLDAQVKIKECELRDEFIESAIDDLFEDYD
ncbi:hypothetical protein [Halobacterium hubeiense]|jgi:hypothetical protein|nr:hypothetical protein [Halobacterium hubeiense]